MATGAREHPPAAGLLRGRDLGAAGRAAAITTTRIEGSARGGLSNFGGEASLQGAAIRCAAFDLNGEDYEGYEPGFQDLGANLCGCPEPAEECRLVSAGLTPPEPVDVDR